MAEAERIADGDDEIADFRAIGIGDRQVDEVAGLDLEHRDVGAGIGADDFRLQRAVVEQLHGDVRGVLDDVRVGDDVAVLRVDDHARAGALEFTLARLVRHVEEATEERVVHQRVLFFDGAAGRDVHDGRGDALQHRGQRRHRGLADGGGELRACHRGPCGEQESGEAQGKLHGQWVPEYLLTFPPKTARSLAGAFSPSAPAGHASDCQPRAEFRGTRRPGMCASLWIACAGAVRCRCNPAEHKMLCSSRKIPLDGEVVSGIPGDFGGRSRKYMNYK